MAKEHKQSDSWLGITILMMVVLAGLMFLVLFPADTYALIKDYMYLLLLAVIVIVLGLFAKNILANLRVKHELKLEASRRKKIQLIEQLIWRSRYSLQSKKAMLLDEDTPEGRDLWKQEKIRYAKEKIFPVVPENEAPMNLVSSLIEKSLSSSGYSSSRLPTYKVQNL